MVEIKRLRGNINDDDYHENKRRKINLTIFEEVSNEFIYDTFEYLDFYHAFEAFYDLNQRFRNLFINSNLPIKINFSLISKSSFNYFLTHIIIPHTHRIQSFRLSNPFSADVSLLILPVMTNFIRLERFIINNIESDYIYEILNHLSSLPLLSSLNITSIDYTEDQNEIYEEIFRLSTLKYCQLSIETSRPIRTLSSTTDKFSSIEHLVIYNHVLLNQINSLLQYVPQLRRLSLEYFDGSKHDRTQTNSIILNDLTHVSLNMYRVSFDDFELLVKDFFRHVQILHIGLNCLQVWTPDTEYLNADRWERLILTSMPNLCIFDLKHEYRAWCNNDDRQRYENQINKFNSLFWIKRQWFFESQYHQRNNSYVTLFYSRNPYRRKCYILHEALVNRVDIQVNIHNTNAIKQFAGFFPNAIELILSNTFDIPPDSIVTNLNRIIPLRQLSKLTLRCHGLLYEQILELLSFTSNIHALRLDSINVLFNQTNSYLIEQNRLFRIVSDMNIVTSMIIVEEISLEKIQLLVALFPRLKSLTISLYKQDLVSIVRFLLTKSNNNLHYVYQTNVET